MPDQSYWLRILKHVTFIGALILLVPGGLLWWLSITPLAPLNTFEQTSGTITQIVFPSEYDRIEISIQTERGIKHLYVRDLYWLEQRSKSLRTLEKNQRIQVRYDDDFFGRDFVEVYEIARGEEIVVSYDDIQWAAYESDDDTKLLGIGIMAYAGLWLVALPFLLVKQFTNEENFSASEHLAYDSVGALLGSTNVTILSFAAISFFIFDPEILTNLWWFLILAFYSAYLAIRELYKAVWKTPQLIVLENNQITFSFLFRSDLWFPYTDIESLKVRRSQSFWKSPMANIQVSQSRFTCQCNPKEISNFDLLPQRLREKNPLCRIEEE